MQYFCDKTAVISIYVAFLSTLSKLFSSRLFSVHLAHLIEDIDVEKKSYSIELLLGITYLLAQ